MHFSPTSKLEYLSFKLLLTSKSEIILKHSGHYLIQAFQRRANYKIHKNCLLSDSICAYAHNR